jgi:hypothetical protein
VTIDREAIEVALFELLQEKLDPELFEVIGRKHIMPPTLQPEQQPALFSVFLGEQKLPGPKGLPGKIILHATLFLYCYDTAGDQTPGEETDLVASQLNALKQNIDQALEPDPGDNLTLGGLVEHCWIDGESFQDPAIFGKQAFVVIPLRLLVP